MGSGSPNSRAVLCPGHRPARTGHSSPNQRELPILYRVLRRGPSVRGILVPSKVFSLPGPASSHLGPASSCRGSPITPPPPPCSLVPGEIAQAASIAQHSPPPRKQGLLSRSPGEGVKSQVSPLHPRGARTSRTAGRGVPLFAREARRPRIPLLSAPGAKWNVRLLHAAARVCGLGA